jgi:hypothetical protein
MNLGFSVAISFIHESVTFRKGQNPMNSRALPFIALLLPLFAITVSSSAEPWNMLIDASLTMTENSYTDNWVGGESGSANWMFLSNSFAEKQLTPIVNNKNVLKLQFGQNNIQDKVTKKWRKPEKSNDLIDFESVFRFKIDKWVEPFASGRIESSFFDNSDPKKSLYFNPVTLTESGGAIRVLMKENTREWTARLGAGFREHIQRDLLDQATGSRSTQTTTDGGLEFVNDLRTPLAGDRINFQSKLIIFKAFFNSKSKDLKGLPQENYWKSPDVNWENIFNIFITKYFVINLYTQLLYDKEIDKAGRFKETLGLGLNWKYEKPSKKTP